MAHPFSGIFRSLNAGRVTNPPLPAVGVFRPEHQLVLRIPNYRPGGWRWSAAYPEQFVGVPGGGGGGGSCPLLQVDLVVA